MANKRKRVSGNTENKKTREVKARTVEEKDAVDRFSDLPDHLLLKIMSSLTIKEPNQTCVLSKRWKDVFTSISDIDLDGFLKNQPLRDTFMNFVGRFLLLRKDIDVKSFRLDCGFGMDPCRISGWVHYALRIGVTDLDLNIKTRESIQFQSGVFTCKTLKTLKLCFDRSFTLRVPTSCCLQNLEVLQLSDLTFSDDESIQKLISSCVDSLEELRVEYCNLSNVNKLGVCSTKLKRLTITSYQGPSQELEINTPNLWIYLRLDGCYIGWGTLFATSPSLETIVFDLEMFSPVDFHIKKEVSSCLLHGIKKIKVFALRRTDIKFIEYALMEAFALESLVVEVRGAGKRDQKFISRKILELSKLSNKCQILVKC
ncbi:F-box/LRR-repeat protein At3g26922-like [Hibiscus syriacus]|uniref:F-box/LRR-repeat protein At3g26922-like n=1 Tax=Hibiscus syriacus TaxID=106335 RepID=UPI00192387C9|nr:F-box/LRR-repeat protein At3g26922-like [Hibiscus syriacus]